MKQKLYITKGIPASGKSTWARNKAKEEPNTVIVNRDSIRTMLKGEYKLFPFGSKMEKLVTDIEQEAIYYTLNRGYNCIVDSTGFMWNEFDTTYNKNTHDCEVEIIDFTHVPLEVCIERDNNREISVGEEVIRKFYNKYLKK